MDKTAIQTHVERLWDQSILPELTEYIRIPNKSPDFDADWATHGFMDDAVALLERWARGEPEPPTPGRRQAALCRAADRAETALAGLEGPLGRYLLELEPDRAEGRSWYGAAGAAEPPPREPILARAGVQVIRGTGGRGHPARMRRIGGRFVEINHCIEMSRLANPIIHTLPVLQVCGIGMIVCGALIAENGCADDKQAPGVRAFDHLLVGGDQGGYVHLMLLPVVLFVIWARQH